MYESYSFGDHYKNANLPGIQQSPEHMKILCDWANNPKGFLVFCGNVGTGKTHFCAAFHNYLIEQNKNIRSYSEQYFFNELKQTIQMNWDPIGRIREISSSHHLILDDMGSSKMTDWQKEMLSELIDMRYSSDLPMLITSNFDRQTMKNEFGDRFYSRIFASRNTIIQTNSEDRRNPL